MTETFSAPDQYGRFGVRTETNGVVSRRIVSPGRLELSVWVDTDISGESAELKALAATTWTAQIKASFEAFLRAQPVLADPLTDTQIMNALLTENGSVVRALGQVVFGLCKGTIAVNPSLTVAQFRAMIVQNMR